MIGVAYETDYPDDDLDYVLDFILDKGKAYGMDGKRIAPRHIGVEVEKQDAEMYDVYYAWDTDTIFHALADGIANRPPPPPDTRGDLPLEERVASTDAKDRAEVEAAFVRGDWKVRRKLVEAALVHPEVSVLDLANAVRPLASCLERQGADDEARASWTEARELYASLGIDAGVAECDAASSISSNAVGIACVNVIRKLINRYASSIAEARSNSASLFSGFSSSTRRRNGRHSLKCCDL